MHRLYSVKSGFTLIELLISMTVFSVVLLITTSTLLVLIDANSRAQSIQAVMSDVTTGLDSMTREIRTGYNYYCHTSRRSVQNDTDTRNCASGGVYFSIIEAGDSLTQGLGSNRISYYYDSGDQKLYRRLGDGDGDSDTNEDEDWVPLSGNNVRITNFEFVVSNTNTGLADGVQPAVTIFIEGEAGDLAETVTDFSLQTTVTQRVLDV